MSPVGSGGRLALFLPALDDGGAERVMLQLAGAFAARGRAVDLVLAVPGGPLSGQVPPGPRVVSLDAGRTIAALPALVRYLRRERPHALLSTLEHANVIAIGAGRLARTGTRLVLREANVVRPAAALPPRARALRALMRPAYRAADLVVAVSQAVAKTLTGELGLPPGKVRTIYNPVVTAALRELAAAPLDDPWFAAGAPPVILGIGRLVPQKDFATLLRAFAEVHRTRRARLLILGEGAEHLRLEALARELGVAADVRLPGFDHNPFRYLARAPLYVLSSVYEGLPGALIQAMACGCRVISSDCPGGSREILRDGRLGALVPPGDPTALGRAIAAALDDAPVGSARARYPLEPFAEAAAVDAYLDALGVETTVTGDSRIATDR